MFVCAEVAISGYLKKVERNESVRIYAASGHQPAARAGDSRRSPDGGGLLVAEHHVTGEGLAVGPDLGPDLRPPAVPGLTLLRVVDPVQQLHRAGAHRAACHVARTETGNGVTTG